MTVFSLDKVGSAGTSGKHVELAIVESFWDTIMETTIGFREKQSNQFILYWFKIHISVCCVVYNYMFDYFFKSYIKLLIVGFYTMLYCTLSIHKKDQVTDVTSTIRFWSIMLCRWCYFT